MATVLRDKPLRPQQRRQWYRRCPAVGFSFMNLELSIWLALLVAEPAKQGIPPLAAEIPGLSSRRGTTPSRHFHFVRRRCSSPT